MRSSCLVVNHLGQQGTHFPETHTRRRTRLVQLHVCAFLLHDLPLLTAPLEQAGEVLIERRPNDSMGKIQTAEGDAHGVGYKNVHLSQAVAMPPVFERPHASRHAGPIRRGRSCLTNRAAVVGSGRGVRLHFYPCCLRQAVATVAADVGASAGQDHLHGPLRRIFDVCHFMQPRPYLRHFLPACSLHPVQGRGQLIPAVNSVDDTLRRLGLM